MTIQPNMLWFGMKNHDTALLEAALTGYRHELKRIDDAMTDIRARLGGTKASLTIVRRGPRKRVLSEAARQRIAAAQKKRWAAYKRAQRVAA